LKGDKGDVTHNCKRKNAIIRIAVLDNQFEKKQLVLNIIFINEQNKTGKRAAQRRCDWENTSIKKNH
jgi:hypothetical protein